MKCNRVYNVYSKGRVFMKSSTKILMFCIDLYSARIDELKNNLRAPLFMQKYFSIVSSKNIITEESKLEIN